jgi:hypothetical protein
LTYNYDPYLEFLLYRALDKRRKITRKGKGIIADLADESTHENNLNAVTSGFFDPKNRNWVPKGTNRPGFCVLKLHGSICQVTDEVSGFDTLFHQDAQTRAKALFDGKASTVPAPILFPWEIMTGNGFIDESQFSQQHNRQLYSLFRGIWNRAQMEIEVADKISFVGLSMHQFLNDGLKFLFGGKEGKAEIVVANPDNRGFEEPRSPSYWERQPHCSAYAMNELLGNVAAKMIKFGKPPGRAISPKHITVVPDFGTFVKTQMKPCSPIP